MLLGQYMQHITGSVDAVWYDVTLSHSQCNEAHMRAVTALGVL